MKRVLDKPHCFRGRLCKRRAIMGFEPRVVSPMALGTIESADSSSSEDLSNVPELQSSPGDTTKNAQPVEHGGGSPDRKKPTSQQTSPLSTRKVTPKPPTDDGTSDSLRTTLRKWSDEENFLFYEGIERFGAVRKRGPAWDRIMESIPTKSQKQVRDQLHKFFNGQRKFSYRKYIARKHHGGKGAWTDKGNAFVFGTIKKTKAGPTKRPAWPEIGNSVRQLYEKVKAHFIRPLTSTTALLVDRKAQVNGEQRGLKRNASAL